MRERLVPLLNEIQQHLFNELAPFWLTHGVDEEYGGYLTYLDENGKPTGETLKTLICQARMIYSFSAAHRANLGEGKFLDRARQGVEFLIKHFWDDEHTGWHWTCAQMARPWIAAS
ncbi:MAG: hypothetical protein HC888_11985 [Candidatus Competibacteraceae bacterium]|nr:hypothetical protein [Candidatus Competibacteraceae bacterium]